MPITTAQAEKLIELVQRETDRRIHEMYKNFLAADWYIEDVQAVVQRDKHEEVMSSGGRPACCMSFGEFKLSQLNR